MRWETHFTREQTFSPLNHTFYLQVINPVPVKFEPSPKPDFESISPMASWPEFMFSNRCAFFPLTKHNYAFFCPLFVADDWKERSTKKLRELSSVGCPPRPDVFTKIESLALSFLCKPYLDYEKESSKQLKGLVPNPTLLNYSCLFSHHDRSQRRHRVKI